MQTWLDQDAFYVRIQALRSKVTLYAFEVDMLMSSSGDFEKLNLGPSIDASRAPRACDSHGLIVTDGTPFDKMA